MTGGDLDQFIRRRRGRLLSEGKVLQLFVQISLAIKHTHDRKVLHRDLKPGVQLRVINVNAFSNDLLMTLHTYSYFLTLNFY
jgi:serine/threonine protein kinase